MIGSGLLGRHSTGSNHKGLEDARGLSYVTVLQSRSHFGALKGQF